MNFQSPIPESEMVLNDDGSIYHLHLRPEDLAETVLLVGDPDRVPIVSQFFDHIELKKSKRELVTHTGKIGNKRLSVISTGMSTANIDIVLTELDALANIDFQTRLIKSKRTALNLIRLGTAGSIQLDVPMDSVVVSDYAFGIEGLAHFYPFNPSSTESSLNQQFRQHFNHAPALNCSYVVRGDQTLVNQFCKIFHRGNTLTCGGFYGPQGRILRLALGKNLENFITRLKDFSWQNNFITNIEMETAGIYVMSALLGHRACSLSTILADRQGGNFTHNAPNAIRAMIEKTLTLLSSLH